MKLLVISGPLRNSQFPLEPDLSIGRDANNSIRLDDPAVSPHHCRISSLGDRFFLTDLQSHSATFVNGIPVTLRELKPDDEIAVGNSVFVFESDKNQTAISTPIDIFEQDATGARTLEFRPDDLLTLEPDSLAALPRPARLARNLSALLQICRGVGALGDEESLPWQLLGMIMDVIPAERAAILLMEEASTEVRSHVAWDRGLGPHQEPVHVSREIIRRVIEEGVSLLDSSPDRNGAQQTLLCVPIMSHVPSRKKPIGLIYLESRRASTALTEEDFRLLTGIASLGAIGIENARRFERLGRENQRLRADSTLTHDMVGRSPRMREVYQFIERVAPTDSTVLIYGESGTGKELVASAIHRNSTRKNQPFVAFNCAALSESLLESELFGHEKGAFTGAASQKKGFLEVAEGGTIFLDEIGELSLVLQAKLLRVLQEREFFRVGGTRPIKINVRFLAATNKDLQKSSREATFRADLFHRLNVISIALPALREHPEDIPALAEHFTARHARNCNRNVSEISADAIACLTQYHWPGNIRELENALERAVVIGSSGKLLADDLPETIRESSETGASAPTKYHDAIRSLKKQLILSALDQAAGNVTEAAKLLGVHANYLHRLMSNFELRPPIKKQTSA